MSTMPTPTTTLALDEINPASFDFWLRDDVERALAKPRYERPVAWHQHPDSGKGFWSITRFDDVAAATRDWETFSSAYGIQAMTDPEDMQYMGAIRSMISIDPPSRATRRSPGCRSRGSRRSAAWCASNQKIAMWYISANRDEKYFLDPYRFDITRTPNEQGAFGTGGAHFCLGAHLARREVTGMFVELFPRLPDMEATAEPERLRSNFIRGIKRLPVAFTPA